MLEPSRLQFGDDARTALVNLAPTLLAAHRDLKESQRAVNRRMWRRPGKACACCQSPVEQDQVQVRLGRRVFHDECLLRLLVEVRRDLRALGYDVEASNG